MATTRQRRANAAPSTFVIDDDRLYTEEDYAVPAPDPEAVDEWAPGQGSYTAEGWTDEATMPDEAFQPDEADGEWADAPQQPYLPYDDAYGGDGLFLPQADEEDLEDELDPLSDELLTDEERAELKRSHWKLLSGLADFAGVIVGTAAILVLLMLLVSLVNWLFSDISQSFILLQKNL